MFRCSVRLSQSKGAEGLRPPQGVIKRHACRVEALGQKLSRLKTVASGGGIRERELLDLSTETGTERRCRTAPQTLCGGLPRPNRPARWHYRSHPG